jgi:homoserine O-acetyltransferase
MVSDSTSVTRDLPPRPQEQPVQGLPVTVDGPLAVNSADDLINPPELGILEREIKRVPKGQAVVIPLSDQTRGHGSHTLAKLWEQYLRQLLQESERRN